MAPEHHEGEVAESSYFGYSERPGITVVVGQTGPPRIIRIPLRKKKVGYVRHVIVALSKIAGPLFGKQFTISEL